MLVLVVVVVQETLLPVRVVPSACARGVSAAVEAAPAAAFQCGAGFTPAISVAAIGMVEVIAPFATTPPTKSMLTIFCADDPPAPPPWPPPPAPPVAGGLP